jgi:hypothetical protein
MDVASRLAHTGFPICPGTAQRSAVPGLPALPANQQTADALGLAAMRGAKHSHSYPARASYY